MSEKTRLRFSKIEDFHLGFRFFMNRPSRAGGIFILAVAAVLVAALVWSNAAPMDDIVRAEALLRPAETISTVRTLAGGQVRSIGYVQGGLVAAGDLLLELDASADILELANSAETMARIDNGIAVQSALLETARRGTNAAPAGNEEAFAHSQRFVLENRRHLLNVEALRARLEIERTLPEIMTTRDRIDEMARELETAELQHALWRNGAVLSATDARNELLRQRENLERRMSDLERSIANATIRAPIPGRVLELRRLNPGDNVVSGEEILAVIPAGEGGLRVELYVAPEHVARVRPGQTAVLRFPGLPPSRYGKLEVPIDLVPADVAAHLPLPVFVVEASLDEPWLTSRAGDRAYLRAGIGASARIVVGSDTVFRMLLRRFDFLD